MQPYLPFWPARTAWAPTRKWLAATALLTLLLGGNAYQAQAQTWKGFVGRPTLGASSSYLPGKPCPDADGNIYVTGSFTGQVTFGATTLTSVGTAKDIVVAKWNTTTESWVWAIAAGGTGAESGVDLAVVGSSVYLVGAMNGNGTTGQPVSFGSIVVAGPNTDVRFDSFIAKLTDNGSSANWVWAKRAGNGPNRPYNIVVNGANIYIAGSVGGYYLQYYTPITMCNGTFSAYDFGMDNFVAKAIDKGTSADWAWLQTAGGDQDDVLGGEVAVSGNSVYLVGAGKANNSGYAISGLWTQLHFGSSRATATPVLGATAQYSEDVYVAKYNDAGATSSLVWAAVGGGTNLDQAYELAVSGSSVYVGGRSNNNSQGVHFGNASVPSAGTNENFFVAKLSDLGTTSSWDWATSAIGPNGVSGLEANGSNVYVLGSYANDAANSSAMMIGSLPLPGTSPTRTRDTFLGKLVDSGTAANWAWVQGVGGSGTDTPDDYSGQQLSIQGNRIYSTFRVGSTTSTFGSLTLNGAGPIVAILEDTPPLNNLVVTGAQDVQGTYQNVTIDSSGVATLTGPLTVNGTLIVKRKGVLNTNCQPVTGSGSFVLAAQGTLRICDAQGIASTGTTGAVQLSGSRSFSPAASYEYSGSGAQVTGSGLPTQVRDLTVNKTSGALTLSGPLSVAQVLRLSQGDLLTNGQALTLLSGPAGTALIDNTGGVVTGPGTMQRYISPTRNGQSGYRHYASPVTGNTLADLATATYSPVVNADYNTVGNTVTPFPTVFRYDESRVPATGSADDFTQGYASPASLAESMNDNLRGFTVQIPATELVDFTGSFRSGTHTATGLTYGAGAQAGWHLLGNPFPSPINWATLTSANLVNMGQAVYVFQSTGPYEGTYRSYSNGVGASPLIAAGQAFFVRVAAPGQTGSLTLGTANRVTSFDAEPTFNRPTTDTRPQLQLTLNGAGAGSDEAYVYFQEGATVVADASYDAYKLRNTSGASLFTTAGAQELSINGLPPFTSEVVVPLRVEGAAAGSFTLTASQLLNFPATTQVLLQDAQTGTLTDLRQGAGYSFSLPTASAGSRFSLRFRPGTVTSTQSAQAAQVAVYPNPAHTSFTLVMPAVGAGQILQATLVNSLGQQVQQWQLPQGAAGIRTELNIGKLAAGVYSLQLQTAGFRVAKRVVVQ
ncbi:T9SS type A sorting domain-containing protein [Hymenobacter chitinivorans]|uniref:Putative secreted protein (Por secretion system target) n=1 Tax=Hymenobacter chitinivorans DSM 11115 TaxID=1121954 RepID=A0A2M9B4Q5_9BACT|nr:T9SS type A sorting domain-containing protein [Hymenobacter chitinivorans]PJJ52913.1 putative secreted protein (Por secretion system target) [Hymenobacter chitinivorans DSM 11115]